jgi:molybdate transport system substrate-binding protein
MRTRAAVSTIYLSLALALSACAPEAAPTVQSAGITVMAAASLTAAFQEIGMEFETQHPGANVNFNFAGSQQLSQQIAQGAPADVFASANQAQMDAVIETGAVGQGAAQIFARNRLVVVLPKDNPGKINRLQDLAKPGLKIDLAAKEVPVGQYTLEFLDKAGQDLAFGADFREKVVKNVVSYENNVKAVLTKVALGEADAGIVYATDAASAEPGSISQLEIPDALNVIAGYPIAVLKTSQNPELARAFIDMAGSPAGQEILAKYGFLPAAGD